MQTRAQVLASGITLDEVLADCPDLDMQPGTVPVAGVPSATSLADPADLADRLFLAAHSAKHPTLTVLKGGFVTPLTYRVRLGCTEGDLKEYPHSRTVREDPSV